MGLQITGGSQTKVVTLTLDVSKSTTGYGDITGLSFAVNSGSVYYFKFFIRRTAGATTTGSLWSINGPAKTYLHYRVEYSNTTAVNDILYYMDQTEYDTPSVASVTSPLSGTAVIEGLIKPSADGTVIARFAPEVNAIITAKEGCTVEYKQIA